ncbi:MAG: hypothetical protein K6U03_08245 [Firmicutes bacterium]|nr:hypothetical protein [Bacillota bacterium]
MREMAGESWPQIRRSRLGAGVVLDGGVVLALRLEDDPNHPRVLTAVLSLAESRVPLVVSYLSLAEAARRIHSLQGPRAAIALLRAAEGVFNLVLPTEEDLTAADGILAQGLPDLGFEEAVAGVIARRLGCSIYGLSPVYHLLHVPVIID